METQGASILVVEDDIDVRETLTQILQAEGYEVSAAPDGREGLRRLQEGARPGVILLDLMMPILDGWELRQAQKADPELASIPVVVMTGVPIGAEDVLHLDAAAYLGKPLDLDTLLGAVRRCCRSAHATAAAESTRRPRDRAAAS